MTQTLYYYIRIRFIEWPEYRLRCNPQITYITSEVSSGCFMPLASELLLQQPSERLEQPAS